jgi:predicted MFS family arabinose efflux permease
MSSRRLSETSLLWILSAVQLVNVLDFMMVMPLGPDFSRALGIPPSQLGWIGGAYTAAAAVAGILGSLFLDRYGRRRALVVALIGLMAGTAAGGLATSFETLLASRVVAGLFGGPATSLALSIVADVFPVERRGRALARLMAAFSVATVLGIPMGLELARLGSWRLPFFAVAAMGMAVAVAAALLLPELNEHLAAGRAGASSPSAPAAAPASLLELAARPTVFLSLLASVAAMAGMFLVIPNLSAYVQFNLGFPRARLGLLYLAGGLASLATMGWAGRLVDRFGSPLVALLGTAIYMSAAAAYLIYPLPGLLEGPPYPAIWITLMGGVMFYVAVMTAGALRNVAANALATQVPAPAERARYMSLQSAVQHLSAALGAFLAARMLTERAGGQLVGMPTVATLSLAVSVFFPLLLGMAQRRMKGAREAVPAATPARATA